MAIKTLSIGEAIKLSESLRTAGKKIVLAGGCFDILHVGHLTFLEEAKKQGDLLLILLESDEAIRDRKGKNRPINSQTDRARMLASLTATDSIISLKGILENKEYDKLISAIKPAIIATTRADPHRGHKERQAALSGASVVDVTDMVHTNSTTKIAKLLQSEL